MFIDYLETDRLIFEPFHRKMSPPELYRYCGPDNKDIEELAEHIIWSPHESILDSMHVLSQMREDWVSGDTAHYCLTHKQEMDFVGAASLSLNYERNQAEIGVWLRKKYWGQELATERAFALMEIGFDILGLDSIIVSASKSNEKSNKSIQKYIEKAGGENKGTLPDAHCSEEGVVTDKVVYGVRNEEFEENMSSEDRTLIRYQWNISNC